MANWSFLDIGLLDLIWHSDFDIGIYCVSNQILRSLEIKDGLDKNVTLLWEASLASFPEAAFHSDDKVLDIGQNGVGC